MFVFVCGYMFIWCDVCSVFTYVFDGVCVNRVVSD
jgi:hypothetical protein